MQTPLNEELSLGYTIPPTFTHSVFCFNEMLRIPNYTDTYSFSLMFKLLEAQDTSRNGSNGEDLNWVVHGGKSRVSWWDRRGEGSDE